ncbi:venom serine carboxypeptidase-like [Rhodnius prolixus]|uniref:Carboxypeptidase n=3 Tax=Rhodnius TaxID=13248 RepID=T1IBR4_RHOPR
MFDVTVVVMKKVLVLCLLLYIVKCSVVRSSGELETSIFNENDIEHYELDDLEQQKENGLLEAGDYGEPLFLTPYIESGNIERAKQAALVEPFYGNITSYSGFLTVNKEYNSNMYFWFFPAEIDSDSAPVVLWLQGGPGTPSLFGLFEQHGPFYLTKTLQIKPREFHWTKTMNVIYIDNPIGTGFSFTRNEKGLSTNERVIGENLYNALVQFYQLFPHYRKNDLFLSGESYGGKFAPAIGYVIDKHNVHLSINEKINLKGIAIGNGFCDPLLMMEYSNYLYQIGLIDLKTKSEMEVFQNKIINNIKIGKYFLAYGLGLEMVGYITRKTGFQTLQNYLYTKDPIIYGDLRQFFKSAEVRKKLHVGRAIFHSSALVKLYLSEDFMQSVKPWIETLIEKYKILIYNGQLDLLVPYPLSINFIRSLNWSGAEEYKTAERKLWYVDNELAGYTKSVGNLTEVLVRNAGHLVPSDQPKWAFDLMNKFARNLL